MCVVCALRAVTRSEPMDKFGECLEPAGELHMGVLLAKRRNDLLGFRFSGITLLDEISQCPRKKATCCIMCLLCFLVYYSRLWFITVEE